MNSQITRKVSFGTSLVAGLGLMLSAAAQGEPGKPATTTEAKGECHGINSCKGKGECGGKGTSCAGTNSCKGKGWIAMTEADCKAKKGKFKAEISHAAPATTTPKK